MDYVNTQLPLLNVRLASLVQLLIDQGGITQEAVEQSAAKLAQERARPTEEMLRAVQEALTDMQVCTHEQEVFVQRIMREEIEKYDEAQYTLAEDPREDAKNASSADTGSAP